VAEILAMDPEAGGAVREGNGSDEAVRFSGVTFGSSSEGDAALKDVDFSVRKGSTVGIIGGTGCGKTTLIHLIPAFYTPASGTVFVDGVPTTEWDPDALRRKVSVVFQKALLFSGSIRDNLRMGDPGAGTEDMERALKTARADEVVQRKTEGLDSPVEAGGKNFSGGQRQRLAIARALVSRPEILILDDSSSALDAATDAALRKNLAALDWDPTVFIVSQRVASVKNADVILVMDEGRICGMGSHAELLKSCEEYREIVDSQTEKDVRA
jgi:ABC-type multidrug transport system fused ATPase/permease subunit